VADCIAVVVAVVMVVAEADASALEVVEADVEEQTVLAVLDGFPAAVEELLVAMHKDRARRILQVLDS
jgi:hypothetical protein